MELNRLLEGTAKVGASDLHLKAGSPPVLRVNARLAPVDHPLLEAADIQQTLDQIMPAVLREAFEKHGTADFSYAVPGVARFRVAAFRQRNQVSIAFRRINPEPPTLESLNLPPACYRISQMHRGMILVTGVTGSGKSTTLAGFIQKINETRRSHIVTLEDPIEYLYKDKLCIVNQVEIRLDTSTFAHAMAHVVRWDPDIILIGEMRDRETVETAIEAADTGHMVFSTLHTSDAKQTINRILHFFEKNEEELILEQLAMNLRVIMSQRLVQRCDVKGVVPAVELLFNAPIVSKLILEGRIEDIQQVLRNRDEDMQSFDVSLALLVRDNKIKIEEAIKYASDESSMRRMVRGDFSASDQAGLIGGGR